LLNSFLISWLCSSFIRFIRYYSSNSSSSIRQYNTADTVYSTNINNWGKLSKWDVLIYDAVWPLETVDIISLGTPSGKDLRAGASIAVPLHCLLNQQHPPGYHSHIFLFIKFWRAFDMSAIASPQSVKSRGILFSLVDASTILSLEPAILSQHMLLQQHEGTRYSAICTNNGAWIFSVWNCWTGRMLL
jgi:hypothetical protein